MFTSFLDRLNTNFEMCVRENNFYKTLYLHCPENTGRIFHKIVAFETVPVKIPKPLAKFHFELQSTSLKWYIGYLRPPPIREKLPVPNQTEFIHVNFSGYRAQIIRIRIYGLKI